MFECVQYFGSEPNICKTNDIPICALCLLQNEQMLAC